MHEQSWFGDTHTQALVLAVPNAPDESIYSKNLACNNNKHYLPKVAPGTRSHRHPGTRLHALGQVAKGGAARALLRHHKKLAAPRHARRAGHVLLHRSDTCVLRLRMP